MLRQIIEIDEEKCDGCGLCVPECHEGALQIIEGKARLISDLFCDGLGACIGHCPQGAINVIEREAEPYDEIKVLKQILKQPRSVLKAHLKHLLDHQAFEHLDTAIEFLKIEGIENPLGDDEVSVGQNSICGCPGSRTLQFENQGSESELDTPNIPSELRQWPVQLHLVNPNAPYFKNSELVIMATCGPIANANVHRDYIKGKSIVVACPKLDYTAPYTDKLTEIFKVGNIKKVNVVIMQVPCCSGLMKFATDAKKQAGREDMPIVEHILDLQGNLIQVQRA
jgi:NAD-dependent dihydropyrimidine dehydrogenase PreA subunit